MIGFEQNPDADNAARRLLNGLLEKHLRDKGLTFHKKYKKFYYSKGLTEEQAY